VGGEKSRELQWEEVEMKKQLLVEKMIKYLIISETNPESLSNIFINMMKVTEILEIQEDL
jgi:hypothetical protein